jgi:hypothetical protein
MVVTRTAAADFSNNHNHNLKQQGQQQQASEIRCRRLFIVIAVVIESDEGVVES